MTNNNNETIYRVPQHEVSFVTEPRLCALLLLRILQYHQAAFTTLCQIHTWIQQGVPICIYRKSTNSSRIYTHISPILARKTVIPNKCIHLHLINFCNNSLQQYKSFSGRHVTIYKQLTEYLHLHVSDQMQLYCSMLRTLEELSECIVCNAQTSVKNTMWITFKNNDES